MAHLSPPLQPVLLVEGGPNAGQVIQLLERTTMGRHAANDVVVTDLGVSRQHAAIIQSEEGFYLRDLSSSNGTFVNRRAITIENHLLKDGDRIQLGASESSHVFRMPDAGSQQTMVQPAVQVEARRAVVETASGEGDVQPADPQAPSQRSQEEGVYEGTVRLNLEAEGNLGLVITFTQQLRENAEFRLLRLTNNPESGVEIWLGLRQPLSLRPVLMDMAGVAEVTPVDELEAGRDDQEPALKVLLKAA